MADECIDVITHLDICSIQERVGKPFNRHIKDNISSWFGSSTKRCVISLQYFWSKGASLLMLYCYMEIVKLKLSLVSLGEIYQLNHWKELNLRRQALSILTSAQSGKCIVSSLFKQPKNDIATEGITQQWHAYNIIYQSTYTGNHMLVYSRLYSISGMRLPRHEINKESPSLPLNRP